MNQLTQFKMSTAIELPSESSTLALGALLADSLPKPLVVCLSGDLGAGKTTLTRGFLRALGYHGAVKSPTFTLVESYPFSESAGDLFGCGLHHFDLYRIEDPEELDFIGFEEYLDGQSHVIIEWPIRAGDRIGDFDFSVALTHQKSHRRAILSAASSAAGAWLDDQIKNHKFNRL